MQIAYTQPPRDRLANEVELYFASRATVAIRLAAKFFDASSIVPISFAIIALRGETPKFDRTTKPTMSTKRERRGEGIFQPPKA